MCFYDIKRQNLTVKLTSNKSQVHWDWEGMAYTKFLEKTHPYKVLPSTPESRLLQGMV